MPRGSKPGERRGGRKKGVVNRTTQIIKGLIGGPFHETATERLSQIVEGKLPCQTCHGSLMTNYILPDGSHQHDCIHFKKIAVECARSIIEDPQHRCKKCCSCEGLGIRVCNSCHKRGLEKLNPELIGRVAMFLRREIVPDLKAVEHTGPGGNPIQHAHTIKFVD